MTIIIRSRESTVWRRGKRREISSIRTKIGRNCCRRRRKYQEKETEGRIIIRKNYKKKDESKWVTETVQRKNTKVSGSDYVDCQNGRLISYYAV